MSAAMSSVAYGHPDSAACSTALAPGRADFKAHLAILGTKAATVTLPLSADHEWLIEARERGNDALVEISDATDHLLARADHPERRTGTRRLIMAPGYAGPLTVKVTGKEHPAVSGTVDIAVFDLAALASSPLCAQAYRAIVKADADFAVSQQIVLRQVPSPDGTTAHDGYAQAAAEYAAADALLESQHDVPLRGEVDLALAGIWYFDLQDWRRSADWARAAQRLFDGLDPYRLARAEALLSAAWIEMAVDPTPSGSAAGAANPHALLVAARRMLQRLWVFHTHRGERYDAALQLNNIALAYSYEGRHEECVVAARAARAAFYELGETPRQALAAQNQAMCFWGLGHLTQALDAFNRALEDLKPDPYPQLYLATLNNTALMNYALGHFDESLRLHDRALDLAIRSQNPREEAQSLYGIGVTYYALGDHDLAREFLERSLAIRTAAFDGRGRYATLRSLATLLSELGDYQQALAWDRESLNLATGRRSRALSRIQIAVHTALAGEPAEALAALDELIEQGGVPDELIVAQARLERAVIERRGGHYEAALRDLGAAIPVFRRTDSDFERFSAELERARTLQLAGRPAASLAAVERALMNSEAIRTRTANPEFRAQLQLPLRPAYDLKLDLLWTKYEETLRVGSPNTAVRIAGIAFRTSDAARAQSFKDIAFQNYSVAARRDLGNELARRERLYQELAGLRFSLESRLNHTGPADPRGKRLQSEIAELQREVDTLNTRIAGSAALRNLAAPEALPQRSDLAMRLPADVAIVAYWVGARAAYAWALTPAGIHWVRLPEPALITAAARTFHDSLKQVANVSRERRLDAASELYGKILRPVEAWVAPYPHWYFVLDGALNYIAFAALKDGTGAELGYPVMSHDIALTPAAWLLSEVSPRHHTSPPPDRTLLVSDPVYERSDPRLNPSHPGEPTLPPSAADTMVTAGTSQGYSRLPATAREAAAIRALFPKAAVDAFDGIDATRGRILALEWSRYRFIHIATHGHTDARIPQLSAIILSSYDPRGERIEDALRAADVAGLNLNAEVVVFSGCDTALGKEILNEGMVGLAYTTLARGAGAVVSSLWPVPDERSANLMTEFYQHLIIDSMRPAAALAAAMRSVLRRNPSADPALWAAFQVAVVGIPGGSTDEPDRKRVKEHQ
jgi:CHAT domain-containing protein/tetratricopeptide (TPR) repeat protein